MHKKYGDKTDRYWKAFLKQWAFIEQHMIDPTNNGWFAETKRDGTLIGDGRKASQWKANYHTARALMNVARMLGEMEAEAGRGSVR
jgi:mannobiose 2-epimerase